MKPSAPILRVYDRLSGVLHCTTPCFSAASRRLRRADNGQAMVEFALLSPLLLLVVTGILSMGLILNQYQMLTLAVSDGARAFALSRNQAVPSLAASDPCAYAATILEGVIPNVVPSSLTLSVTYTPPGGTATVWNNVTASSGCPGESLSLSDINGTVVVQGSYSINPLIFGWNNHNLTLRAQDAEQIQ